MFDVVYVGLTMPRAALTARLDARGRPRWRRPGLAEEVEALLARGYDPGLSAMQGIGYREFVRVVRGELGHRDRRARSCSATPSGTRSDRARGSRVSRTSSGST